MGQGKFISYLRVSMPQQGAPAIDIDAQRAAIFGYLKEGYWQLLKEFVELESGRRDKRPRLQEALELCWVTGGTLLIAKLDRLSRDPHFLSGLQKAGVKFIAVDRPSVNDQTIDIVNLIAQEERKASSQRIKEALAAAKARGIRLGNPANLTWEAAQRGRALGLDVRRAKADDFARQQISRIRQLQEQGASLRAIARTLNDEGIRSARGKVNAWTARSVKNLVERT